ncbi:MAG: hypothetical protein ACTSUE_02920 [Promethearchaeota archaeon]
MNRNDKFLILQLNLVTLIFGMVGIFLLASNYLSGISLVFFNFLFNVITILLLKKNKKLEGKKEKFVIKNLNFMFLLLFGSSLLVFSIINPFHGKLEAIQFFMFILGIICLVLFLILGTIHFLKNRKENLKNEIQTP